jgi:hypothetical protein
MLAFIIPYRNRKNELKFFDNHMKNIVLKNMKENIDYVLYYIHQDDNRPFNRGAMKNIGFLVIKKKFPKTYKSMTIIFNDVDTLPKEKTHLNYETIKGNVKHFIGYNHTLGGIISINGEDFETSKGFPNHWSWGWEDVVLYKRCKEFCNIDRTSFIIINFSQNDFFVSSITSKKNFSKNEIAIRGNGNGDSFESIKNLEYNENNNMINVTNFYTNYKPYNDMLLQNYKNRGQIIDHYFEKINTENGKTNIINSINLFEKNLSNDTSKNISMTSNYKKNPYIQAYNKVEGKVLPQIKNNNNTHHGPFSFTYDN